MAVYEITLHSPMGPRRGTMTLYAGGAEVALLGCESLLAAEETVPGRCRLTGRLRSPMGPIGFAAEFETEPGVFDCTARTEKGDMRLTGTRMERSETGFA